jgi:hypothetical protein
MTDPWMANPAEPRMGHNPGRPQLQRERPQEANHTTRATGASAWMADPWMADPQMANPATLLSGPPGRLIPESPDT